MSGTEKHNFEYPKPYASTFDRFLATNQAAAGEAMVMFPLSVACRMYTMPTALIPHDRARFEPELGEDSFIYQPPELVPAALEEQVWSLKVLVEHGRRFVAKVFSDPSANVTEDDERLANRWLELTAPPTTPSAPELRLVCMRSDGVKLFATKSFDNRALRPTQRIEWPENFPPLTNGRRPPPETVAWITRDSQTDKHAVNPSKLRTTGAFGFGHCYFTSSRFFHCLREDCGCRHMPFDPPELILQSETGALDAVEKYIACYEPTEIPADLPEADIPSALQQLADNHFPSHQVLAPQNYCPISPKYIFKSGDRYAPRYNYTKEQVAIARYYWETYRTHHGLQDQMYLYPAEYWDYLTRIWNLV